MNSTSSKPSGPPDKASPGYPPRVPCWVACVQPVSPYDVSGFKEAVLADPQGAVLTVSQLTAGD